MQNSSNLNYSQSVEVKRLYEQPCNGILSNSNHSILLLCYHKSCVNSENFVKRVMQAILIPAGTLIQFC